MTMTTTTHLQEVEELHDVVAAGVIQVCQCRDLQQWVLFHWLPLQGHAPLHAHLVQLFDGDHGRPIGDRPPVGGGVEAAHGC